MSPRRENTSKQWGVGSRDGRNDAHTNGKTVHSPEGRARNAEEAKRPIQTSSPKGGNR
jgi:hypothetical protein